MGLIIYLDVLLTLLTAYQLFIVYFCQRMRGSIVEACKDIRMRCLFITFLNGTTIAASLFRVSLNWIVRSFTILEMARYSLLFTLCIFYAHAVSRNIIKWRKRALNIMLILFFISIGVILIITLSIVQKQINIEGYSRRICADKLLMILRGIPLTMALIMSLFMRILG